MTATGGVSQTYADDNRGWLLDSIPQKWDYQSAYSQKLPTDDDGGRHSEIRLLIPLSTWLKGRITIWPPLFKE